jgi:hypothetical protein
MKIVFGAAIAATFALAACSTVPELPFDHATSGVKTIGLLTPGFPSGPTVYLASDVGQSFGLVGGLIDAGIQSDRESKFSAILARQQFVPAGQFYQDLSEALRRDGYTVVAVPLTRNNSDYMERYPGPTTAVDAYLDVVVKNYGYMAAGLGSSNPYRPSLLAQCRLVRASDSSVLMQDVVALNPLNGGTAKAITLSPDPGFSFPGFEDIEAAPKKAADGVGGSFTQTTSTMGTLLK